MISFTFYNIGKVHTKIILIEQSQVCADKLFNDNLINGDMKTFYGHPDKMPGNIWNHAEAMTEYEWSKCFRLGLYE